MLKDEYWAKLQPILQEHIIYNKPNLRNTIEGILYRMHTGLPWRDLPDFFGKWIAIYQQFNRWSAKDKLMQIFRALATDPDCEWEFIDSSIVNAHQHSTDASSDDNEAIGKSVCWQYDKNPYGSGFMWITRKFFNYRWRSS